MIGTSPSRRPRQGQHRVDSSGVAREMLLVGVAAVCGLVWVLGGHQGVIESPDLGIGLQEEIDAAQRAADPGAAAHQLRERLASFHTVEECAQRTGWAWLNCQVPSRALVDRAELVAQQLEERQADWRSASNHKE